MQKRDQKKNKKGFSLVEVLISLLVLSMGITSVVAMMAANTKTVIAARDQIIAAQLVQEGIELARNLVDNDTDPATKFVDGTNYVNYHIHKDGASPISFSNIGSNQLYLKGGFYLHDSSGTVTKFFRRVDVDASVLGKRMITSIVSWNDTGIPGDCNIANKCESASAIVSDVEYIAP